MDWLLVTSSKEPVRLSGVDILHGIPSPTGSDHFLLIVEMLLLMIFARFAFRRKEESYRPPSREVTNTEPQPPPPTYLWNSPQTGQPPNCFQNFTGNFMALFKKKLIFGNYYEYMVWKDKTNMCMTLIWTLSFLKHSTCISKI